MNNVVKTFAASAALTLFASAAFAQVPATPPPAHSPGILSRLFHPKPKPGMTPMHPGMTPNHYGSMTPNHYGGMTTHPGTMGAHPYGTMGNNHPMMGGRPMGGSMGGRPMGGGMMGGGMMGGQIIGNKNSHVYHMAGDRGAMPAPQNRVYFPNAAAAEAAGYHMAGGGRSMTRH